MSRRTALVTGVGGQDGRFLARRLAEEGVEVHGVDRTRDPERLGPEITCHTGDLADHEQMARLLDDVVPDVVYNLGGISSVAYSWSEPRRTAEVSGMAAVSLMGQCLALQERTGQQVRFVQAASAEIFGQPATSPQDEQTPIGPVNPYGAAKAFAHMSARVYRSRDLHCSSLILYNHESPERPDTFVTRKITQGAASIALGAPGPLRLGNLDARRDWGWAPDFVDAMVRAAGADEADDYVIATGVSHSVREFVAAAFTAAGIEAWEQHVEIDPQFFRPADATELVGDATKARERLGWQPTVPFEQIVARMVEADIARLRART